MTTWDERLRLAEERCEFTEEDKRLAADYCACSWGEAVAAKLCLEEGDARRGAGLRAEIYVAKNLLHGREPAMEFYTAVRRDDIDDAMRIHEEIKALFEREDVLAAARRAIS